MNEQDKQDEIMSDSEMRLMEMARELPAEVKPARDLWPGIAAGMHAQERTSRWPKMFAQAAAVLLLVGASSGLTWLAMNESGGVSQGTVNGSTLTFEPVSGSFGSQYMLGPDFQDARSSIAEEFEAELERLPASTRAEIENNLATIRAAIAEINKALAEQPDSVLLQKLLLSSYNEELAIMRKVDGVSRSVTRRTDI